MKKLIAALFLTFAFASYAVAGPLCGVFLYGNIPASDTTVLLHRYCRTLQIWSDSGAADLYVELNSNVATVGGATTIHIAPGGSWQSPSDINLGVTQFHVIGSAATGKYTVAGY